MKLFTYPIQVINRSIINGTTLFDIGAYKYIIKNGSQHIINIPER